jgi:hypothetical protein
MILSFGMISIVSTQNEKPSTHPNSPLISTTMLFMEITMMWAHFASLHTISAQLETN